MESKRGNSIETTTGRSNTVLVSFTREEMADATTD